MTVGDFFISKLEAGAQAQDGVQDSARDGALVRELKIVNKKGLHARATAKLVQCVESFDVEVTVTRCGETVGGTSIMGILTLGAGQGSTIVVSTKGSVAAEAMAAIEALVASRFGEDE
jgi:phosphocarrier protein HPr